MKSCDICHGTDLKEILFLGSFPLPNVMQPIGSELKPEMVYPLQLLQCEKCSLVQLGQSLPQDLIFPPDYSYRSGTTQALKENFTDLVEQCKPYLKPEDLVVDIGGNDGTLLNVFRDATGATGLNVEPTFAGRMYGGSTWKDFFSLKAADSILAAGYKKPSVITACNVFAHIPDPHDFLEGVKHLLADDGVFVIEVQYLGDLQFDTIYQEHRFYYSMQSLNALLYQHELQAFKAVNIPTHGGSLRVFCARRGQRLWDSLIIDDGCPEVVDGIKQRAKDQKLECLGLIGDTEYGTKIYGIGLPSRAVTLINYFGLGDILDCIVEINGSPKVGMYAPGTRCPVFAESTITEEPDFYLLLSWHLGQPFIDKWKQLHPGVPIIVPLPEARIV